ncbi:MAG: TIM barrel protein [Chloroflexota bacterium]|nr:TIM barrel protein [Chloroflexota bacterium]
MTEIAITTKLTDIRAPLELAQRYKCGLEIQTFSNTDILDGDWQGLVHEYQTELSSFAGSLACHGAFFDMMSASMDARIVALTKERYLLNLNIAEQLGATRLVFHTNFLPMIRTEAYRRAWLTGQSEFWQELGWQATEKGITLCLENMWDPDPFLLRDLLNIVNMTNVACCLDVSHAYLYGQQLHGITQWLEVLSPCIHHVHVNNTLGVIDEHLLLNAPGGIINYAHLLPQLAALPLNPDIVIEMDDLQAAEKSLVFLSRVLQHQ